MSPDRLHQLWELVETVETDRLLLLDQQALADVLIRELSAHRSLLPEEIDEVRAYIYSRLPLIRDLAQWHQGSYCLMPTYA